MVKVQAGLSGTVLKDSETTKYFIVSGDQGLIPACGVDIMPRLRQKPRTRPTTGCKSGLQQEILSCFAKKKNN
jgi:hypothetical protein